jgi:hypothetical protein
MVGCPNHFYVLFLRRKEGVLVSRYNSFFFLSHILFLLILITFHYQKSVVSSSNVHKHHCQSSETLSKKIMKAYFAYKSLTGRLTISNLYIPPRVLFRLYFGQAAHSGYYFGLY